jgi:hypothetical protein
MSGGTVAICDLGRVVTGKTPNTKNSSFFDGKYQFVTASDLDWKTYYCRTNKDKIVVRFALTIYPCSLDIWRTMHAALLILL